MREFIVFDPSNKEHRAAYNVFLKTNSWGNVPIRFVAPKGTPQASNLLGYMQRVLLEHYINREFTS